MRSVRIQLDRAGAQLVRLVGEQRRRFMAKPSWQEVVKIQDFRADTLNGQGDERPPIWARSPSR